MEKQKAETELKDKLYEVRRWSERAEELATGKLPNGELIEDYDGAFAAIAATKLASTQAQKLMEDLFNAD